MPSRVAKSIEWNAENKARVKIWRRRKISWHRIAQLLGIGFPALIRIVDSDPTFPAELRTIRGQKSNFSNNAAG